jgi:hypothetical protein
MTVKEAQPTAGWVERCAESFHRTERCLFRSRQCLEKSYEVFDRKPRTGDAAAKRIALVRSKFALVPSANGI